MDEIGDWFEGAEKAAVLFAVVRECIDGIGDYRLRVHKTQISFSNRVIFAVAWMFPLTKHGKNPLMLGIALRRQVPSPRWRGIVEPYPGRWMHHLELNSVDQIDDEVRAWLSEAWVSAM
jgi:hypothetical protein